MSQYKSDEPFGLLPKKTAMDLDSVGGLFSMPLRRDIEPTGHRDPRLDVPNPTEKRRTNSAPKPEDPRQ